MTTMLRARLLAVALSTLAGIPAAAQQAPLPAAPAPSPPWWRSEQFRKELNLTADQIARIDRIWESTRTELRGEWEEFTRLESKLSRLIQSDSDDAALSHKIDRVETARASANKTRTLMLLQMRRVLVPEQRKKFDVIHARWEEQRAAEQRRLPPPPAPAPAPAAPPPPAGDQRSPG